MKAYRVAGTFRLGRRKQPFTKEVEADDEGAAVEWVYSVLGSNHRLKRRQIEVNKVVEIPEEEMDRGRRRRASTEEE
jgi:large subunit ribosomal protein LX